MFTGVLALVAFLQLSSLNRAERISANIAQAAKESAEAARAAVKLSDKNAERQLRAYIEVEIEKIDFNSTPSTPTEVVLKTKNVGQTPARETITVSWVDLRPWPHPPGGNWSGPTNPNPTSKSIINPGQARSFKTGTARGFTAAELAEIAIGNVRRFYIYGSVTYIDVFGADRVTEFCFAVKGTPGQPVDIAYCQENNNAT